LNPRPKLPLYVNGDPVNLSDPTGHIPCAGDQPGQCSWAGRQPAHTSCTGTCEQEAIGSWKAEYAATHNYKSYAATGNPSEFRSQAFTPLAMAAAAIYQLIASTQAKWPQAARQTIIVVAGKDAEGNPVVDIYSNYNVPKDIVNQLAGDAPRGVTVRVFASSAELARADPDYVAMNGKPMHPEQNFSQEVEQGQYTDVESLSSTNQLCPTCSQTVPAALRNAGLANPGFSRALNFDT